MSEIYIAGTGIWYPDDSISNDEIVESFNAYVDSFNDNNKDAINNNKVLKPVSYTHLTLPTTPYV